jgi:hypothetical protein
VTEHGPVLPVWLCDGCAAPWPCAVRRRELLTEYASSPLALAVYMGSYLNAAAQDMSWAPPAALDRRFLGWLP